MSLGVDSRLSVDIWCKLLELLDELDWVQLARSNRAFSAFVKKHRLGCRRCNSWLKRFDEDNPGISFYPISCNDFTSGLHMYCMCGAIHVFCKKCNNPILFISHCGHADRLTSSDVVGK